MMLATAIDGLQSLLAQLVNPAARAILLACGAGVGLAAFRVRAASLRLFTWTAVLYAALAMPLLGWLLPPLSIPAPTFFPQATEPVATEITGLPSSPIRVRSVAEASLAGSESAKKTPSPEAVKQISPPSSSLSQQARLHSTSPLAATTSSSFLGSSHLSSLRWSAVAAGIYLAVALLLLIRLVVGLIFARRLIQASQPIREPRVTQKLACSAYPSGLSFVPQVAESEFISVPVTMGALRPTILLPAGWREWDHRKLDAVVAHELSHVARRDALTQRLSLLHRAIFWFSPLAWWLDRHLADMAEQASDEAALSSGTDRNDYARTLLGFFEALQAAPGRVWWQGVSMAKAGQAERRVERILAWKGAVTVSLKKSIAVMIIALAVPVVYLAAAVRPAQSSQPAVRTQAQAPPAAQNATPAAPATPPAEDAVPSTAADALDGPEAPALAPATPPPTGGVAGGVSTGIPAPVRPTSPIAPIVPVRPVAPPAAWVGQVATSSSTHRHRYSYSYGYDDEQRFVIVTGNTDSLTMSGSSEDAEHAEKLRKQIPGDFIWFERDERSYIIRDQATIDRARKLWAPQEELGKKQEALGEQQEALGKQQQALGERMRQIQVKVPDMTAELDKLRGELKQLSSGATVEQVGRIQSEIGELQSRIGQVQSHAGEEQSKLGEEMGALGEKQGKLGAQQGELGRQQGELAEEASRQMKQLLDEAIKKGTARPEPQTGGTASL
jgi:beta-lactamase regulating signal transducer with metallopeptidase domain